MNLADTPRFYTALAQWLACLVYLLPGRRRLRGGTLVLHTGVFLLIQSLFLVWTKEAPIWLWTPCMLVSFGFMFIFILWIGRMSVVQSSYICICAFVLSEWMASVEWQLHCYLYLQGRNSWEPVVLLVFVYAGCTLFFGWLNSKVIAGDEPYRVVTWKVVGVAFLIGTMVFVLSNMGFVVEIGFPTRMSVFNARTLVDLSGIAILYAFHFYIFNFYYHMKVDALQLVLQKQYEQYQQSRINIDLINQKYHDLKHQIGILRKELGEEQTNAHLDRLEADIKKYEMENKTGNAVLDTILTDKSYFCLQNHITISCIADGTLLKFMDDMDICTIFGNALDNAIEGLREIRDREKRLINVLVCRQNTFLLISFENFCANDITFRDGLPETTKGDNFFHGFGLKSIRSTVERYQGSMNVQVEDNWFELVLLIPIPE